MRILVDEFGYVTPSLSNQTAAVNNPEAYHAQDPATAFGKEYEDLKADWLAYLSEGTEERWLSSGFAKSEKPPHTENRHFAGPMGRFRLLREHFLIRLLREHFKKGAECLRSLSRMEFKA